MRGGGEVPPEGLEEVGDGKGAGQRAMPVGAVAFAGCQRGRVQGYLANEKRPPPPRTTMRPWA